MNELIGLEKLIPLWIEDYQDGLSTVQIGKKYNVGSRTVWKYLDQTIGTRSIGQSWLNNDYRWGNNSKPTKRYKWKDILISYYTLHKYIKKQLPQPDVCSYCKNQKKLDLANISQEYKDHVSDWIWLCRICHIKQDQRFTRPSILKGEYQ